MNLQTNKKGCAARTSLSAIPFWLRCQDIPAKYMQGYPFLSLCRWCLPHPKQQLCPFFKLRRWKNNETYAVSDCMTWLRNSDVHGQARPCTFLFTQKERCENGLSERNHAHGALFSPDAKWQMKNYENLLKNGSGTLGTLFWTFYI